MAQPPLHRTVAKVVGTAAIITAASCSGVVTTPGDHPGGTTPPDGTTSPLCQGATVSPGPSYVRRLTRLEYNNTVRDLLGDTSNPADHFPAEERQLGFDNNAAALTVS